MAKVVDTHTGQNRRDKARGRKSQCDVAEIDGPLFRRREFADRVIRGDIDQHECDADDDAGRVQRDQPGQQERQQRSRANRSRAQQHRCLHARAIDPAAGRNRQQCRQQGIHRHQNADSERGFALVNGEQGDRHAAAVESHVIEYHQDDDERKWAHRDFYRNRQRRALTTLSATCFTRAAWTSPARRRHKR